MLRDIFYWGLNMSVSGAVTGLLILAVCKIKRIPRRIVCHLWAVPFLRMIVPVGWGSKYGLMSLLSSLGAKTVPLRTGEGALSGVTMMNYVQAADGYFPISYQETALRKLFGAASLLWLFVAFVLILAAAVCYTAAQKEIRRARLFQGRVYLSDQAVSPAVYGVFRPKILLPAAWVHKDLTYILAHEEAHIHRKDNLRRMAALVITLLHWFNPFAWLFLKKFLEELELACDESVVAKHGDAYRKGYALSLVNAAEKKSVFASAFGGADLHPRIERILSYRKISVFSAVCFIAFAVSVAYLLLTNAA